MRASRADISFPASMQQGIECLPRASSICEAVIVCLLSIDCWVTRSLCIPLQILNTWMLSSESDRIVRGDEGNISVASSVDVAYGYIENNRACTLKVIGHGGTHPPSLYQAKGLPSMVIIFKKGKLFVIYAYLRLVTALCGGC